MLDKISKDKKELQNTVQALETVNAELKRAQRDIIRAEKLASIGRLSSGIAHEIGNPIGIILGYIDLIKQGNLSEEEQQDFLTRSEDEINRVNNIIRQLLDLSRPMEGKPREISMHQLLLETLEIIKPQPFMAAIQFETDLVAEKDRVVSDPELLRQVILNLMISAVDAITAEGSTKQGRIHIASRIETLPVDYAPGKKAENIVIVIKDNGPGISEEHIDNVFDPFYTTKEPGKGTGLGLSVSFMIIEKLGGTIAADCTATEGTTMRIYLPVASTAEPVHSRQGQDG
jgi:signal transduction histidine kinase